MPYHVDCAVWTTDDASAKLQVSWKRMQMVSRTHVIRNIEPADREKNALHIAQAEERGDLEEAEIIERHFDEWGKEQGQTREQLVCAVCGDVWLTPTSKGTARPHARRDVQEPSWDKVRQIRKEIFRHWKRSLIGCCRRSNPELLR